MFNVNTLTLSQIETIRREVPGEVQVVNSRPDGVVLVQAVGADKYGAPFGLIKADGSFRHYVPGARPVRRSLAEGWLTDAQLATARKEVPGEPVIVRIRQDLSALIEVKGQTGDTAANVPYWIVQVDGSFEFFPPLVEPVRVCLTCGRPA